MTRVKFVSNMKIFAVLIILGIGAIATARYLRTEPEALVRIVFFVLAAYGVWKTKDIRLSRKAIIVLCFFSVLLGTAFVLGYHIHVENIYNGLIDTSYIIAYDAADIVSFLAITVLFYALSRSAYIAVSLGKMKQVFCGTKSRGSIFLSYFFFAFIMLMIPYMIYLLLYYPGFVFTDSLSSVNQALGIWDLGNHHPVMYTLFIKLCLHCSHVLGRGNTFGIAIYSVIQSCYMAAGLAYLINWLHARFSLRWLWCVVLMLAFGWIPYIATYSIAVWKDPFFVISLLWLSLLSYDLFLIDRSQKKLVIIKLIACIAFALIAVFSRNNGIYVIMFTELIWVIVWLYQKRMRLLKTVFALAAVIVVSLLITGPAYDQMGIAKEKVESVGIFLQQMARTASYDEPLKAEDQDYMDTLLPDKQYRDVYRPGCVDMLKWDASFQADILEEDFFGHWFSIGKMYPVRYFEAWEFQTAGFWAPNIPQCNNTNNISGGVPINLSDMHVERAKNIGITTRNLLRSEKLKEIFVADEWSVSASWIHWFLLFVIIVIFLNRKRRFFFVLLPTIGVVATLLIASPIMYWARYGLLEQLLLPMFFILLIRADDSSEIQSNG